MSAAGLVDTHCHIQSAGLKRGERVTRELWAKSVDSTPDGLADAASEAGVTRMICVGCDLEDSRLAADFARTRDDCWASAGIHPHEARHYAPSSAADKLADFAEVAAGRKVVSIGECGLDYYYGHSPKDDQVKVLEFQMDLALKLGKPLIFHVRDAFDDFWPVFDNFKGIRGVVHSFTDSAANLKKVLDRGLYVGVNGIATFARGPVLAGTYRSIPSGRLLLETDAPFLTPTPYRGTVNEPKRLVAVADFLAELRGEERGRLAEATTGNARKLFGI